MRHRHKTKTLDRNSTSRRALLGNLICQLFIYEKIATTEAKARAIKPLAEKFITRSKVNSLANRRLVLSRLPIKKAVKKLFEVYGPRYEKRNGGYLRIVKTGVRTGDAAKMAIIEFV